MKFVRCSGGVVCIGEMSSSISSSCLVDVLLLVVVLFVVRAGTLVGVGLVDLWFALSWSKCPLTIAMDRGACFLTRFEVSSGHVVNHPLSIALHQVERTGEKQQA